MLPTGAFSRRLKDGEHLSGEWDTVGAERIFMCSGGYSPDS